MLTVVYIKQDFISTQLSALTVLKSNIEVTIVNGTKTTVHSKTS